MNLHSGEAGMYPGTNVIAVPISATFEPCPDITAYELALLLRYLHGHAMYEDDWTALGKMQRHFTRP